MKYLLTGGTGFIGGHLAGALAERGETVHLLVRSLTGASHLDRPGIRLFEGDITDKESVERAMKGCTHVFHLAAFAKPFAKDPSRFHTVNVEGTINLLEAAKREGVRRVVFTSTAGTLLPTDAVRDAREDDPHPGTQLTPYAETKSLAEKECRRYAGQGLEVVIVAPTRVFGPGAINESNSVTRIISLYRRGRWRIIPGNGRTIGNYVFVNDVVRGHLLAMEKGRSGQKYNLGGENLSFNSLFRLIGECTGRPRVVVRVPYPLLWLAAAGMTLMARLSGTPPMITPGWIRQYLHHRRVSSNKARIELGYAISPVKEGIGQTLQWLKENKTG
jgi:farnesol dehydrogenase